MSPIHKFLGGKYESNLFHIPFAPSLWVHIQHFKEIMLINLNFDMTTILLYNII